MEVKYETIYPVKICLLLIFQGTLSGRRSVSLKMIKEYKKKRTNGLWENLQFQCRCFIPIVYRVLGLFRIMPVIHKAKGTFLPI